MYWAQLAKTNMGKKNPSLDVIEGRKIAPKSFRTGNHSVTWGTWKNKGPPHHVMLSFCCFCTRVFRAPPIRLGDGSLLPITVCGSNCGSLRRLRRGVLGRRKARERYIHLICVKLQRAWRRWVSRRRAMAKERIRVWWRKIYACRTKRACIIQSCVRGWLTRRRYVRLSGKETHRDTETQTHRHTDTQTHRHTDTQTHRHTDTQTHRASWPEQPRSTSTSVMLA